MRRSLRPGCAGSRDRGGGRGVAVRGLSLAGLLGLLRASYSNGSPLSAPTAPSQAGTPSHRGSCGGGWEHEYRAERRWGWGEGDTLTEGNESGLEKKERGKKSRNQTSDKENESVQRKWVGKALREESPPQTGVSSPLRGQAGIGCPTVSLSPGPQPWKDQGTQSLSSWNSLASEWLPQGTPLSTYKMGLAQ